MAAGEWCEEARKRTAKNSQKQTVTPDFPQSEIAATNFYDSGGSLGKELGEELGEIFCTFSRFICCAE